MILQPFSGRTEGKSLFVATTAFQKLLVQYALTLNAYVYGYKTPLN